VRARLVSLREAGRLPGTPDSNDTQAGSQTAQGAQRTRFCAWGKHLLEASDGVTAGHASLPGRSACSKPLTELRQVALLCLGGKRDFVQQDRHGHCRLKDRRIVPMHLHERVESHAAYFDCLCDDGWDGWL